MELFIAPVRLQVVELIHGQQGLKILDVATGTGKQAFAFAKKGYDVVGIDLSEDMLEIAHRMNKYDNVEFTVADATKIPFDDNCFDVTCISLALHDMPLSIRKKVLSEMVRVTQSVGTIAIIDYTLPKTRIWRILIYHIIRLYESKYYADFIKSDVYTLLQESGIQIQKVYPMMLSSLRIIIGVKKP